MPFLQFALLTLDGTVYSKPTQFATRKVQSAHCAMHCAILNMPLYLKNRK